MPDPSPDTLTAVDREALAHFVANAISRSSQQHVPVGYRVADALLSAGYVTTRAMVDVTVHVYSDGEVSVQAPDSVRTQWDFATTPGDRGCDRCGQPCYQDEGVWLHRDGTDDHVAVVVDRLRRAEPPAEGGGQ